VDLLLWFSLGMDIVHSYCHHEVLARVLRFSFSRMYNTGTIGLDSAGAVMLQGGECAIRNKSALWISSWFLCLEALNRSA
jgi:hypothetical protein